MSAADVACLVKRSSEGLKAPGIWQKSKGRRRRVGYMAVAYGIVYSWYRSQPNDMLALQGCCVSILGSSSDGIEAVVIGVLYAGAE